MKLKDEFLVINQIENYAIFTLDGYGQIASWNKGARRLIGYEEEEVIGLPGSIVFTPEDVIRLEPEKEMREATKKGVFETRRWHIGKYGMRFQAESSLTTLRNDKEEITGFVKVMRDENNHHKNAEEDGRFFKNAIDLFCIVSLDGQIKRVNPAFLRTLEPATEELPSTNIFELVHPDDRDEVEAEFSKLMRGQPSKNIKHRFSIENGSSKRLAWAFFPDITEGLAYGVGREISDHKEEAREPVARIRDAVSNYLTDDFLATLSAELKDPLNTIRDFSELLMRTHHTSQIAQIRWAAEIIHRHAEAQAGIIRDLLDDSNSNKLRAKAVK
ncbi:MAG: PAS domain S-box protein [Acidobacteria bacterium]|nr:PAS domain S-box protein [Acidobacteriota bacterium]